MHIEDGIKFCPISLVKSNLKERKINLRYMSEQKQCDTLELVLREEEVATARNVQTKLSISCEAGGLQGLQASVG
jgi:hypothetical protein